MLNKNQILQLVENLTFNKDEKIFIHHPITEDVLEVIVKRIKPTTIIVGIPEESEYFGQPDFEIKKYEVLSK